jgi:hypothetical protein
MFVNGFFGFGDSTKRDSRVQGVKDLKVQEFKSSRV